ncbi:hypothetical protein Tco_0924382 [Tanacetum coccineum]|uniref:Uncharacterized protein n=1 Tax=Tanacetum coccineum TaxID=301880 RepID=A0ABQ5D5W0_9ASTR
MYNARLRDDCSVSDMICNNKWKWPSEWYESFPEITHIPILQLLNGNEDRVKWINKRGNMVDFSIKTTWLDMTDVKPNINWWKMMANILDLKNHFSTYYGILNCDDEAIGLKEATWWNANMIKPVHYSSSPFLVKMQLQRELKRNGLGNVVNVGSILEYLLHLFVMPACWKCSTMQKGSMELEFCSSFDDAFL